MSAILSTKATAKTFDNIKAGLADMQSTIGIIGHLAHSPDPVKGAEWCQVRDRLLDLFHEVNDRVNTLSDYWKSDIIDHQAAIRAAGGQRPADIGAASDG